MQKWIILALCLGFYQQAQAQQQRWQQKVNYNMDIDFEVETNSFKGKQTLIYYNNSNETLTNVFYHLYFNAFQPNSMMDMRSRMVNDPDMRVADRISKLSPSEIGYQKIKTLTHNGKSVKFETNETILEVKLNNFIKPNSIDTFVMEFEAQVPIQIRRSGRDNSEGVRFSMTQWYPKMCNFDEQGWHANPYVGREFYGIWGEYSVNINIDKNYIVGGTGYLSNKNEIGFGYEDIGSKVNYERAEKITWKFYAPNVHDFAWAADPDYLHDVVDINDTLQLHFIYQDNPDYKETWRKAQDYMTRGFKLIQTRFGAYPFRQYTFIQGGDGGMEYPMATLITGKRNIGSLVGVMVHELMHNWFQMLMATNESLYGWMDEGFTSYASNIIMDNLFSPNKINAITNIHDGSYKGYFTMIEQKIEEPLSTHADHFISNTAYGQAVYSKGCVFLHQLEYIIGEKTLAKVMLDYYNVWKFRHPNPNDFIRIAEKASNLELDWYKEYFIYTTQYIDYAVKEISEDGNNTKINLENLSRFPMPIEVQIVFENANKQTETLLYYIPLDIMRGEKQDEGLFGTRIILPDWKWTHPKYELIANVPNKSIKSVIIDPSLRLADYKRGNNTYMPPKK
jgi:Peptidase family M1 domain